MKCRRKQFGRKWAGPVLSALILVLMFGSVPVFSQQGNKDPLEGIFRWTAMDYQAGKYREVLKNMELLLTYLDEKSSGKEKHRDLKGRSYLLMGAACEQLKRIDRAREYYHLSMEILEKPVIENLDFASLVEYRSIISGKMSKVSEKKEASTSII